MQVVLQQALFEQKELHPAKLLQKQERELKAEIQYFPIPESSVNEAYTVEYVDSWMNERSYGGERQHEGTDLMMSENKRGVYPVCSMTDGVIEQMGWLKLGGYRIGIRSEHGYYFYYAHLQSYAEGVQIGDSISAGTFLGFAGDSGYSEVEGTVGNFPVHLHLGIYETNEKGEEQSLNPFPYLQYVQAKRLLYRY